METFSSDRKLLFIPISMLLCVWMLLLIARAFCEELSLVLKNFQLIPSPRARRRGEELRCFTVSCHTQLPGHQVIDIIPDDRPPMPQRPPVKEVPPRRLIRLINNSINDLSSFPKSLMIWVSLVFESLIFEIWCAGKCQRSSRAQTTRLRFFIVFFFPFFVPQTFYLSPSLCLSFYYKDNSIFWHLFFTFTQTWRQAPLFQSSQTSSPEDFVLNKNLNLTNLS